MARIRETFRLFFDITRNTAISVGLSSKDALIVSQNMIEEFGQPEINLTSLGTTAVHYTWRTPKGLLIIIHDTKKKI